MWDRKTDWLTWLHKEREKMEEERRKRRLSLKACLEEEVRRLESKGLRVRNLSKIKK